MKRCQNTISKEVEFSGIGVHTGEKVTIKFIPALENSGIRFQRIDLPGQPIIEANLENIHSTSRSTNLSKGKIKLYTIEHLLAALYAYNIDNLLIKINAQEPPIGDGSSSVFIEMLEEAGIAQQKAFRPIISIKSPICWTENDISIIALPSKEYKISYTLNYPKIAAIRAQYASFVINKQTFQKEISPCRTFVLYHEVANLMDRELIKGGSLENAVVIDDETIFSKEGLKFFNEMARHKILDLIGDLSLLQADLESHIIAIKSGHTSNVSFAKKISSVCRRGEKNMTDQITSINKELALNCQDIMEMLPHRYPFLLIDRVLEMDLEKNIIVGQKNVTINEPFFQGHFPNLPLMPGVLILEALAQTGGILIRQKGNQKGCFNKLAVLLNMNNVKFRAPVHPGDVIELHVEMNHLSTKGGRMTGKAMVNKKIAAQAEIGFALTDL